MDKDLYEKLKNCSYYTSMVIRGNTGTHKTINQYRILKDLGEGAYSIVKLADIGTDNKVQKTKSMLSRL